MKRAAKEGLYPKLTSTSLGTGGGGDFYPEIMEQVRLKEPGEQWIDFKKGIVVLLESYTFTNYFTFPVFTDKIMVFNRDITTELFSYIEDESVFDETGVEGTMVTPGTPDRRELVNEYWRSRILLSEYLKEPPYSNSEIMIFEHVPKNILTLISE